MCTSKTERKIEMRRRSVEFGAVAICGGGGQGDALILRLVQ
jgi:acetyl-CoA acetyltransferase